MTMHMTTLWEHRLVTADHIVQCMQLFDNLQAGDAADSTGKRTIRGTKIRDVAEAATPTRQASESVASTSPTSVMSD